MVFDAHVAPVLRAAAGCINADLARCTSVGGGDTAVSIDVIVVGLVNGDRAIANLTYIYIYERRSYTENLSSISNSIILVSVRIFILSSQNYVS